MRKVILIKYFCVSKNYLKTLTQHSALCTSCTLHSALCTLHFPEGKYFRGRKRYITVRPAPSVLVSESESCDDRTVALDIDLHQILEEISSATDHLVKSAAAVIVVRVCLEMLGERSDSACENRNLYLGRAGITFAGSILGDYRLLFFFGHVFHLMKYISALTQLSAGEMP